MQIVIFIWVAISEHFLYTLNMKNQAILGQCFLPNKTVKCKMIKFTLVILFIAGSIMIYSSETMSPLKNEASFQSKYSQMGPGDSEKYFQLRDEQLTGKYRFFDVGLSLSTLSLIMLILSHYWSKIKSPPNKLLTLAVGLFAVGFTYFSEMYVLTMEADRNSFPWWADTLAIPAAGVFMICLILFFWVLAHSTLMLSGYRNSSYLSSVFNKSINKWLGFVSSCTIIVIGLYLYYGSALHIITGMVWLYFYLSLAAGRIAFNKSIKPTANAPTD